MMVMMTTDPTQPINLHLGLFRFWFEMRDFCQKQNSRDRHTQLYDKNRILKFEICVPC